MMMWCLNQEKVCTLNNINKFFLGKRIMIISQNEENGKPFPPYECQMARQTILPLRVERVNEI